MVQKNAQYIDEDLNFAINVADIGDDFNEEDEETSDEESIIDEISEDDDFPSEPMSIESADDDDNDEDDWDVVDYNAADDVEFVMPLIPGADDEGELEVSDADDEEEEEVVVVSTDPWDWKSRGMGNFIQWLYEMIDAVPRHSGRDTTGVERALAHFENLNREITKAMRVDFKGEIDAAKAEKAREQIQEGMKRLIERLEKLNKSKFSKKGDAEYALT